MEEHEDPYIVAGNRRPLEPGHAFSVEPGIYVAGRWGMRLEDIVVATADGPDAAERLRPRPRQRRRLTLEPSGDRAELTGEPAQPVRANFDSSATGE